MIFRETLILLILIISQFNGQIYQKVSSGGYHTIILTNNSNFLIFGDNIVFYYINLEWTTWIKF